MTARAIAAELHVDCVEPTARYVCHRCGDTEGPVTGPATVRAFVEHVRTVHAGRCNAQTTT
jgi:hypothetical protein